MFYTIYKITNKINGKFYIGKHQTHKVDDYYYGSGKKICEAINKYGKDSFIKEILFIFDNPKDMDDKEKEIITEEFVSRRDTYNIGVGGEGGPQFKGRKHSEESKILIRQRSGVARTEEQKRKTSENNKLTNESRGKKVSAALKGKPKSEEHKQKIREAIIRKHASRAVSAIAPSS